MNKTITKKTRFEIFKRDNFICQYCGKSVKDGVVLNVDHIIPKAKGGGNEEQNLITSCFECNSGKRHRTLDDKRCKVSTTEVNKQLKRELKKAKDREEQLTEYYKLREELQTSDPELKVYNKILSEKLGFKLTTIGYKNCKKLFEKAGFDLFLESVDIVGCRDIKTTEERRKYLCGVLINKIKCRDDPLAEDEFSIFRYYMNHPNKRGGDYYVKWQIRPFIESIGKDNVIWCIDRVFNEGDGARSGYFASVLQICQEVLDAKPEDFI